MSSKEDDGLNRGTLDRGEWGMDDLWEDGTDPPGPETPDETVGSSEVPLSEPVSVVGGRGPCTLTRDLFRKTHTHSVREWDSRSDLTSPC